MLKVVIVGYGEMFTNLIAASLDANCKIVGVLRRETVKHCKFIRRIKDLLNPTTEYNYIKSYNLPEIDARGVNTKEFRKQILKLNPDIILVGSWGEKFEKETFNLPKIATINAHPSLLPKYRGPNPYFWAIRNKETSTGITFHLMDDGFDTGAILAQEEVKIYPADTGKSLKERVVLTARGVACGLLQDLDEDIIIPLQQREDRASYYSYPQELELDFEKSVEDNYALINASYPWSKSYFFHNLYPFTPIVQTVSIGENNTTYTKPGTIIKKDSKKKVIGVLCGDGKVLNFKISFYKNIFKPFTGLYIETKIKIGDLIR